MKVISRMRTTIEFAGEEMDNLYSELYVLDRLIDLESTICYPNLAKFKRVIEEELEKQDDT